MQLVCDNREKHILSYFPKTSYILTETLSIGDYAIQDGLDILYVFERKTWSDLAASLKDGRYEAQIKKLKTLVCPVFVIIEGKLRYAEDSIINGIEFFKLEAAMRKLYIHGINVIRTADMKHTCDFLLNFLKQTEKTSSTEKKTTITTKIQNTDAEIKNKILLSIPGIGSTTVNNINMSLRELSMLTDLDLQDFKTNTNRKLGKKAISIVTSINPNYTESYATTKAYCKTPNEYINYVLSEAKPSKLPAKILAEFPGISKKTAEYICEHTPFIKLIHMPVEELEVLAKSESKKIGHALAKKIMHFCML